MRSKFFFILPWLISIAEFVIIIYLLLSWVNKIPEPGAQVAKGEALQVATSSAQEEKPSIDSRFKVGDTVNLTVNTNLRDKPSGELIQTLSREEVLELAEGPIAKKGSWWWKTRIASTSAEKSDLLLNLTGYISEGYWLKKK